MNIIDIISATQEFKEQYKNAVENTDNATRFWNTYNLKPLELLLQGQYQLLRDRMFQLLQVCKGIDSEAYEKIHKGHPYFFIGITSYRLGDYQTSISFFDAALAEDLKSQNGIETPSHLFFLLKGDNPRNAAQSETQYVETKVKRSIDHYNKIVAQKQDTPKIDIQDLRDIFIQYILKNKEDFGLRTLLTAFITFVVEWDFRNEHYDLGVKNGTAEPLFMHLFRGCVLFESLLSRNPFPKPKHDDQKGEMGKLINYYKEKMRLDKLPAQFTNNNGDKIESLEGLLVELTNLDKEIEDSILVTYWLRNVLGHSLAWNVNVDKVSYQKLYLLVITACLHAINCLWRNPQ